MRHQQIWERAIRIFYIALLLFIALVKGATQNTVEVSTDSVTIKAVPSGKNELLVRANGKAATIWVPGLDTKGDVEARLRFLLKMADDGADPYSRFIRCNNVTRSFKVREYYVHAKAVRKAFRKVLGERDLVYITHLLQ